MKVLCSQEVASLHCWGSSPPPPASGRGSRAPHTDDLATPNTRGRAPLSARLQYLHNGCRQRSPSVGLLLAAGIRPTFPSRQQTPPTLCLPQCALKPTVLDWGTSFDIKDYPFTPWRPHFAFMRPGCSVSRGLPDKVGLSAHQRNGSRVFRTFGDDEF